MGGLTSPKGGDTKTTTQVNQVPSYVSAAQQNLYQSGQNIASPFLQTPSYTTAGINADQSGAYDLTRYLAQGAFTGAQPKPPAWYGSNVASGMNPAATFYTPQLAGDTDRFTAAQTGANDFQQFMNPYTQAVIDPAVANLRRQSDINAAQIGAQGAAAGSFGGSRDGIRQAQNTRALGEQAAQLVPQLLSQGYTQAQGLAQGNTSLRQQAAQANSSANNAMAQFNAGAVNQAGQTNAASQNAREQYLANLALQGRSQDLSAMQAYDALQSSDQTRKMQAIQALLGIGTQQQQLAQSNLNVPLQYLQALAALVPQNTGGTQTTVAPNTAASPLQTIGGLGLSILGMGTGGGSTVLGGLLK